MNHHRPRAFAVIAVFTVLVGWFYVSPWRPTNPAKAESMELDLEPTPWVEREACTSRYYGINRHGDDGR